MAKYTLRILHLSDLHARAPDASDAWRRRRVLGNPWIENLEQLRESGAIDLVCFTGDLAFSGHPAEYDEATAFIRGTLDAVGLGADRLFVVPGNHDVRQGVRRPAWNELRSKLTTEDAQSLSRWMAGGGPPRGFDRDLRSRVLSRGRPFWDWVRKQIPGPEGSSSLLLPSGSPHKRLGYRVSPKLPGLPFQVHVIGLDTAWLSGDADDQGKLSLTDDQIGMLTTDEHGQVVDGLRLVLCHHPLGDLIDGSHATRLLAESADLLLRGHRHEAEVALFTDPDRKLCQFAAGCLYEHDRYPNGCQLLTLRLDETGAIERIDAWFRCWSDRGFWFDDDSLYRGSRGGRLMINFDPDLPRWKGDPRVADVFVGRENELAELQRVLVGTRDAVQGAAVCSLVGMPGVGKSYLADRFVHLFGRQFPRVSVRLVHEAGCSLTSGEMAQRLADEFQFPGGPRLWDELQNHLSGALLHIENVDGETVAASTVDLVNKLPGCTAIVTGRYRGLDSVPGWSCIFLKPFEKKQALQQLEIEWRAPCNAQEQNDCETLVKTLDCLPLAIRVVSSHLRIEGRTISGCLQMLLQKGLNLAPAGIDEVIRADRSRRILATSFDLSLDEISAGEDGERLLQGLCALGHLPESGFGRSLGSAVAGLEDNAFEELIATAWQLSLLDRVSADERVDDAWKIHPLLSEYLRNKSDENLVQKRITDWFLARLPQLQPGKEEEQGLRWSEIQLEWDALSAWLECVPAHAVESVAHDGSHFAKRCGPFGAWITFYTRFMEGETNPEVRSFVLLTLAQIYILQDEFRSAEEVALAKVTLDRDRGAERDVALAIGILADVSRSRGDPGEALRIRSEEELPVFKRIGDTRSCVGALSNIADLLQSLGESDEAIRILRDEALPSCEEIGDVRMRAIIMDRIANILKSRGKLDEAIRIRREEVLPVCEKVNDVRAVLVVRTNYADTLLARGRPDDVEEARLLLTRAFEVAARLKIPEEQTIKEILRKNGLT